MAGEIVEAVIRGRLHGQMVANVLHFRNAGELGPDTWLPQLDALTVALIQCYKTVLLPGLSNDFTYQDIIASQIVPELGPQLIKAFGDNNAGGEVGSALPGTAVVSVQKKAALRGRRNRGGFRISGIPETNHTSGQADAAFMLIVANFLACLVGKFLGPDKTTDWQLVIHGKQKKNKQTGAIIQEAHTVDVTNMNASSVLGTQVTRKIGRGA